MIHTHPRRLKLGLILGGAWGVLIFLVHVSGLLGGAEELATDMMLYRRADPLPGPSPLALAAIDRLPADRPWPWARLDYALLLRSVLNFGPRGVVFEMLLNEADAQHSSFDGSFANMVDRTAGVTFAAAGLVGLPSTKLPANLVRLAPAPSPRIPTYNAVVWPLETFSDRGAVGLANLVAYPDESVRSVPLVYSVQGRLTPSLVLQAVSQYLDADWSKLEFKSGVEIVLRDRAGRRLRRIPLDAEGRMRLRYRKTAPSFWRENFDHIILYSDQAERGESPGRDLSGLRGRLLWVGRTFGTGADFYRTPLGIRTPVQIQMEASRCILQEDYLRPVTYRWVGTVCLGAGLLFGFLFLRFPDWVAAVLGIAGMAGVIAGAPWAMASRGVLIPVVALSVFWPGLWLVRAAAATWLLPEERETTDSTSGDK